MESSSFDKMAYPYTPPPTGSPKNNGQFNATTRVAAQDSYFYSAPNSPSFSHQQVIIHQQTPSVHHQQLSTPLPPRRTPSPSGRITPPKPIYYSPTNPVPSPHSASRPKPRLGYRKRILSKISSWIRKLYLWAKENPIKAGLITFLPVLALAGATRAFNNIGKLFGKSKKGVEKAVEESRSRAKDSKKARKEGKKYFGWGLDNFVDFNCSKGGPVDGVLKILQMWVNHICRVSPSMIPRTMSIFLELYFLELEKPF